MRCDPHGRATLCGAHLFGLKLATRNDARCVAVALGNWTAPPCEPPRHSLHYPEGATEQVRPEYSDHQHRIDILFGSLFP